MLRARIAGGSAALLLALAGCGGDSGPIADYDALAQCLDDDLTVDVESGPTASIDVVGQGAGEGVIQLQWGDTQFANIAVERSSGDAEDTLDQYGEGFGDLSHFEQNGNVVIAYANEPAEDEASLVNDCIVEASGDGSS